MISKAKQPSKDKESLIKMFDSIIRKRLDYFCIKIIQKTKIHHFGPDFWTYMGFFFGIFAIFFILDHSFLTALLFILLNRLCDGFDGLIARFWYRPTLWGGFIDIVLDFFFYSMIVLAFGLSSEENLKPSLFLLTGFILNGISFLAFGICFDQIEKPQKAPPKLFFYLGGLTEGFETIVFFSIFCLFPENYVFLAYLFATLCFISFLVRLFLANIYFRKLRGQ